MTTLQYLQLTNEDKCRGVFIRGDEINGEYKRWWSSENMHTHSIYKEEKMIKDFLKSD